MSRCFPFPPPGYTLSRASSESLIESIKLQKEKEKKAKEQRKEEKRREKKEKKREKKEKRKDRKEKSKHSKSDIAKTQSVEFSGKTKDEFPQKGREANTELLERSNLTEEHGQPICLHAAPSTSSDSTENSHKRKRQSSPADVSRGHGNVIRIRLGSKKQSDSSVLTDEHKICSTSGRAEFPTRNDNDNGFKDGRENSSYYILDRVSNDGRFSLKVKREKEPICSTSLSIQAVAPAGTKPPPIPKTQGAPMHKDELRYKNLIEDWVPPQLVADGCDDSDLDWLFKGKNKDERPEKRQRPFSDGISCSSSSSLWRPQAQYLREVDVYALPFTVPF